MEEVEKRKEEISFFFAKQQTRLRSKDEAVGRNEQRMEISLSLRPVMKWVAAEASGG